jgi:HlyD family secretion protein
LKKAVSEFDSLDEELLSLRIDEAQKVDFDRRSRSKRRYLFYVILLLILAGGSWVGWNYLTGVRPVEVDVVLVQVIPTGSSKPGMSGTQSLPTVLTAGGYIIPRRKIQLSSKVTGRVASVEVEKGDLVKKGQLLVKLEDAEFRAQVDEAYANLQVAQARLKELETGSRPQEIEQARANVELAEANLRNAKLNYDRAIRLFKSGVISKGDYDKTETAYEVARAQVTDAKKRYELIKLGPRREQIELARSQVEAAKASLAGAQTLLEATEIRAPIDGTILEKLVEVGEMVTTSFVGERGAKSSVVSLADLNDLQVELDISQSDFNRLQMNQKAIVTPEAYSDRKYDGILVEIAPEANRQKATVQVKVKILNPDKYLRPEMNAKVTFLADEPRRPEGSPPLPSLVNRIIIPKSALIRSGNTVRVFLVQDSKAVAQEIKLGGETEQGFEVLEGLVGGEKIIVGGLDKIKPGDPVKIKGM